MEPRFNAARRALTACSCTAQPRSDARDSSFGASAAALVSHKRIRSSTIFILRCGHRAMPSLRHCFLNCAERREVLKPEVNSKSRISHTCVVPTPHCSAASRSGRCCTACTCDSDSCRLSSWRTRVNRTAVASLGFEIAAPPSRAFRRPPRWHGRRPPAGRRGTSGEAGGATDCVWKGKDGIRGFVDPRRGIGAASYHRPQLQTRA